MSNIDYSAEVETIWRDNRLIALFKFVVLRIRLERCAKPGVQPIVLLEPRLKMMGKEIYPYFEKVGVKLNPTREGYVKREEFSVFLQDILGGVKPILAPNASSTPRGKDICIALLAWMFDMHPEYLSRFIRVANWRLERSPMLSGSISLNTGDISDGESNDANGEEGAKGASPELVDTGRGIDAIDAAGEVSDLFPKEHDQERGSSADGWLPPIRLPAPRKNEKWICSGPIDMPEDFSIYRAPKLGIQRYTPTQLIWARDHIFGIVSNVADYDFTRLIVASMKTNGCGFFFQKQSRGSETSHTHIQPVTPSGQEVVVANRSGVFFIAADFSLYNHAFKEYGTVQFLGPQLRCSSDKVKSFRKLPTQIELTPDADGSHFGFVENSLAVSSNGDVFQQVYSLYDSERLGVEGRKSIHWRPIQFEPTSFMDGRETPTDFKATLLPIDCFENKALHKFSSSGRYVLMNSAIACLETNALLKEERFINDSSEYEPHFVCRSSAWHPKKDLLAFVSYAPVDKKLRGRLEVWRIDPKKRIAVFDFGHTQQFLGMDWSPDGTRLAVSNADGSVRVIDLASGQNSENFLNLPPDSKLWFSPDGNRLAVQARDEVLILDASSCDGVAKLDGNLRAFVNTPWHHEGKHIASVNDGKIEIAELQFQ